MSEAWTLSRCLDEVTEPAKGVFGGRETRLGEQPLRRCRERSGLEALEEEHGACGAVGSEQEGQW